MANTNEPFRRVGANSWKELLDQVNLKLQDPPAGCDAIDEIGVPEECHRWSKGDIQEVHDKLNQMPGDCFTFQSIPDLWKKSIIDDVEGQLENSWCDCDDEDCLQPCSNAQGEVEIFLGTVCVDDNTCTIIGTCATVEKVANCRALEDEFDDEIKIYSLEKAKFAGNFSAACYRQAELDVLNAELETLENELEGLTDPDEIAAKEAEIDAKEAEIVIVEAELAKAIAQRDAAKPLYLASGQRLTEIYFEAGESICEEWVPIASFVLGQSHPPSDATCYNKQPEGGGNPITGIGAECFRRNVFRCEVKWSIDGRHYDTVKKGCIQGNDHILQDTGFRKIVRGEFDINGNVVVTSWLGHICPPPIIFDYCGSTKCLPRTCFGADSICGNPQSERCGDYKLFLNFPDVQEPVNCDREPCKEEPEPEPEE